MESLSTAEHVEHLTGEYRELVSELGDAQEDSKLRELLAIRSDWTNKGAATVVRLSRRYGTFILANALALAEALDIEDGDCGL